MTTPASSSPAPSQDIVSRRNVVEGDARMLGNMRKEAQIRGFTIFCDEGPQIGGTNSAPPPLAYFASSIVFWEMTQIERYARMMKVELGDVRGHVAYHVAAEGSVLAQTVQACCEKIEIHYEVESPAEPAQIAGVLRNARNGCYARQTVSRPGLFHDTISLNGAPFNLDDYPPPAGR